MAKKIKKVIRLHIAAGAATPAPPVGPSLAQHGVNIGEFCKKFNDATKDKAGFKLPVDIIVYEDRSYDFKLHEPPSSALIKKAAGVEKGSGVPNKTNVGKITKAQLEEIAKQKMGDLNTDNLESAKKTIAGTAKNMGITVE
ncbi:MAG: 50S ribosomal protein L11 [Candidatus Wildermuthbacteria bacterium]|nr:50S ribosomal protein L11 [Candidatus Wildermuthbacteria bacterium]